jgi:predicted NUDIX family NTP pyrophosphohydrolase
VKLSAGTLLYRQTPAGLEVLLVHPSGPYNRKAPWSIPKGVPSRRDADNLEETARRETQEETGVVATGPLVPLGDMIYKKSRKQVHCFAGRAPEDAAPRPTSWEVDDVRFVPLAEARMLLHPDQVVFLDRLLAHLEQSAAE